MQIRQCLGDLRCDLLGCCVMHVSFAVDSVCNAPPAFLQYDGHTQVAALREHSHDEHNVRMAESHQSCNLSAKSFELPAYSHPRSE